MLRTILQRKKAPSEQLAEPLVRFVQVVKDTPLLYLWFISLEKVPGNYRVNQLKGLSLKMEHHPENRALSQAIQLMIEDRVYHAVLKALFDLKKRQNV